MRSPRHLFGTGISFGVAAGIVLAKGELGYALPLLVIAVICGIGWDAARRQGEI